MAKQKSQLKRRNSARFAASNRWFGTGIGTPFTVLAVGLMLGACGGSNNDQITQEDLGSIRVLNAVADSPTLNFLLEGATAANLQFGQISGFQQTIADEFSIDVASTAPDGTVTPVLDDFQTTVIEQTQTTVVLAGTTAGPIGFEFSNPNPDLPIGSAEYRLVNTAGAGTVDVFLTQPGADLGSPVASVPDNAASELISTDAGTRQLLSLIHISEPTRPY